MLKYFSALVTLFTITYFSAQVTIFEENFQSPNSLSQWKMHNEDGFAPAPDVAQYTDAWILTTDPENVLDTVASATSYFTSPERANRWLISPAITLGAYGNFVSWEAKSFEPSYPEDYTIFISTTNDSIQNFTDTLAIHIYEDYVWSSNEMSLLGYENQQIYLAFVLKTYDGNRLFLDDIKVRKEDPLAISELKNSDSDIYPNITNEVVHISKIQFESASIYSYTGQYVCEIDPNQTKIDVRNFQNGTYYVRFVTKTGVENRKFVKF